MSYTIIDDKVNFYDGPRFCASYFIRTLKGTHGPLMIDQWRIVSNEIMDEIRGKL